MSIGPISGAATSAAQNVQATAKPAPSAKPVKTASDPDHDGDVDGAGPDVDGKGVVVNTKA